MTRDLWVMSRVHRAGKVAQRSCNADQGSGRSRTCATWQVQGQHDDSDDKRANDCQTDQLDDVGTKVPAFGSHPCPWRFDFAALFPAYAPLIVKRTTETEESDRYLTGPITDHFENSVQKRFDEYFNHPYSPTIRNRLELLFAHDRIGGRAITHFSDTHIGRGFALFFWAWHHRGETLS